MRLATETAMTQFDAIPGAQVWHIANHINNDPTILRCDVMAIFAGTNMDKGSVQDSKNHLVAKNHELTNVVLPLVESGCKVFVVDPVPGPIDVEQDGGDHFNMVRAQMKKAAKGMKAKWVTLNDIP